MYKKILIVGALFFSAFLLNTTTARADTTGGGRASIESTETARTDGVLSRTMHVKLDGKALTDYYSLTPGSRQVELAYVLITDPSVNQQYLETHSLGVVNGVFLYRKECKKDSSSETDPNFTCTIPQFTDYGTFGDEVFLQSALGRDSWPLTNIEYFNIMDVPLGKSGPDVTNLVTTPTADGATITGDLNQAALDQIKNNGQWNDVRVWYSGVKSETSSAGTYAQAISWQSKIPDQANLDASNNAHSFKITLTGLLPGGQYVFDIKFNDLFFTSFKDFTIPSVSTSATSTTAGFGPNAYGCSTDGQNNTYCMLAPLPIVDAQGKIDPTGKLNVSTGVGDYLKGMIKLVMGLIMVFAVFMVIVGGIEYMSSVQVGEKEGAKTRIIGALGGVVLALSSYLILNTINPNLVNITVSAPQAVINLVDVSKTPWADSESGNQGTTTIPSSTVTAAGVFCPGSGGSAVIPDIIKNFKGKVTYRFGGGHGSNQPPWSELTKWMCPVGSGTMCRSFCPPGQLCLDCSAFVDTVLKCAGLSSPALGGTDALFASSGAESFIGNNVSVSGSSVTINGTPLKNGDLVGYRPSQSSDGYGHVLIFSEGKLYDSHGGNNGRIPGGSIGGPYPFTDYVEDLREVYRIK